MPDTKTHPLFTKEICGQVWFWLLGQVTCFMGCCWFCFVLFCFFLIVQQIAIPWSRKGKPTPVFLPGKFHGPKSLGGEQYTGSQRVDTTEPPEHTCTHTAYIKCPLLLKDSCIKKNNNKGNTLCKWPGAVSFDINNKSLGSSLQPYEHHLALQTGQ